MTFLSVKARCNLNVNKENNVCKIVTKHCLTWNADKKIYQQFLLWYL